MQNKNNAVNPLENHIREGVMQMEPIRVRWLLSYLSLWGVTLLGSFTTYMAYKVAEELYNLFLVTGGISLAGLILAYTVNSSQRKALHKSFDEWREKCIILIDNTASYSAYQGLASIDFDASRLNNSYYNRYYNSNYLAVGNIQSSTLSVKHVYNETYTDSQGRTQTREVVVRIFDGILIVLPARLPHPCWTILKPGRAGLPNEVEPLTVASPYLTKHYSIGSSDKFASHRTLTPALMEAIWDYRIKFKYLPGYSYINGKLYITIPEVFLDCGSHPGKWMPVTITKLERITKSCESSIAFLHETSKTLVPT